MNRDISVKDFVALLGFSLEKGRDGGWLEESDVLFSDNPLSRKTCARMIHEFLKKELKETDESNIDSALVLKDLYDCRVCVNHIMQVFSKGIMEPKSLGNDLVFGNEEKVSYQEAMQIVSRIFEKKSRVIFDDSDDIFPGELSYNEVFKRMETGENTFIIDVRPEYLYEKEHIEDSINIPFTRIVSEEKKALGNLADSQAQLFLYCENGYLNEIAQRALVSAGVENVFRFCKD